MIRGFFRLVGLLLLAGGFVFMVYDGARWVADQTLRFTRSGQFWNDVHQSSQQAFRTWVEAHAPWLWSSVIRGDPRPAGFRRHGRGGHSLDAAVPAAQAADRLFAELTAGLAPAGRVPIGAVSPPERGRGFAGPRRARNNGLLTITVQDFGVSR